MKTYNLKQSEVQKNWILVDAKDQVVGRLASEIARILRGKHKASYTPHLDNGDHVVVINADKIKLSGNKMLQKVYYKHSNYIGGLKATRAEEMLEKTPDRILSIAVKGMLPKNKISRKLMTHLKIYAGEEHPHTAQKLSPMSQRTAGVK